MNNNFNELKKKKPKIRKNVFQIVNGLWCGDINTAMDYTYLNNKSISCLINCCENPKLINNEIEFLQRGFQFKF